MDPQIKRIKKILYATDLSKNSAYAFLYATDLARCHDARIIILHTIEPIPPYVEAEMGTTDEDKKKHLEWATEEIKKRLQWFCKKAEDRIGPPCGELVSKFLVPRGHPPEEILNAADKEDCDLIVLGTHGKGFLAHTFLGSVSSAVLQRTRKPVFIIPLPDEKFTIEWDRL
jgi:nucleotide-binding universal stress UspA family protein